HAAASPDGPAPTTKIFSLMTAGCTACMVLIQAVWLLAVPLVDSPPHDLGDAVDPSLDSLLRGEAHDLVQAALEHPDQPGGGPDGLEAWMGEPGALFLPDVCREAPGRLGHQGLV